MDCWLADYPDPDNFLRQASWIWQTGWQNEAYRRLIEAARGLLDQQGRMALYEQAQRILVDEAPIIPLLHERIHALVKPWVRRFPTSPIKDWFWKDVILEPHD